MSKGTPLKALRIPQWLETEIMRTIERRNFHSKRKPWNWTDFCLTAIEEKIIKMARSGKRPRPILPHQRRAEVCPD